MMTMMRIISLVLIMVLGGCATLPSEESYDDDDSSGEEEETESSMNYNVGSDNDDRSPCPSTLTTVVIGGTPYQVAIPVACNLRQLWDTGDPPPDVNDGEFWVEEEEVQQF